VREGTYGARGSWRFEILKPLGSGGFGAVYAAHDHETEKRVALKELTRVGPSSLVRFKQEFRALSDVHHPNLVSIKELIEQDGRWYIVMELIEGQDLTDFVRAQARAPCFDEERLRKAFLGVARGLSALHAYGLLHRDLKPSNVRVTHDGRAVLLDFGLATTLNSERQSTHGHCVGTIAYMAPEQLDGRRLGRPADWYAFGTCLYEALTGRLPYEGGLPVQVAHDKQQREAAHPSSLVADLPEDLSALCVSLLQISAELRPSGPEVLRALEDGPGLDHGSSSPTWLPVLPERVFRGREVEIEHLERALAHTDEGALRIVLVEGESGVGKSEVVAEFLRQQQVRDPHTLVLRGRCYENEHVSYKAFDCCIDELAPALKRLGQAADALLPPDAGLLVQLFPVLADVPAIARAASGTHAADPTARRLQAFAALAALLRALAEEHPLILAIDDLQWADTESFRLLRAFVEDARKPPMLVLCTVRPRNELEPDVLAQLEAVRALQCVDVIPITGLPRPQAEALARALLGPSADPKWASIIALESRGHPLFLSELIHFSRSRDLSASGSLSLEAALRARIERLPRQACALLELVALAARPHRIELFAQALEAENLDESVSVLLAGKLLRVRRDQELGCFHDRIRHVMVGLIASTRIPHLHMQLALALERDLDADPTEQATHWDLAEVPEQAVNAYERAGEQALRSLAFMQAERLYARALTLLGTQSGERYTQLTIGRADALGFAGRSAEAAALYQRAAELDASEEQRLKLRSKTAKHLMLSGDLAGGLLACQRMLNEIGMRLPRSDLGALLRALWDRLVLGVRGYELREHPARIPDPRGQLALDLLNDLMRALAILRTSAYLALSGQHVRRALLLSSPVHAAQAYANEGWLHTALGRHARGATFFERSRVLCARIKDPGSSALLAQQEGSALVASWDWVRGSERLAEAERLYQQHVAHDPWSLTVTRYLLGVAWFRLGEHRLLAEKMDLWIGEARERLDRVAVALLSGMGHGSSRHIRRGAPHEALRELDDAIAAVPSEPFSFAHLGHMAGTQQALTLIGPRAARDWLLSRQKQLSKPQLVRTRFGREALSLMRAAAALRASERTAPSEQKLLLSEVRGNALWLARQPSSFLKAFALHLQAQASALEGNTERALEQVRAARQGFARIHYMGAHGADYLEGMLEGGQAGSERCAKALSFFRDQGWSDPEHALALIISALPSLKEKRAVDKSPKRSFIHHYEVLAPLGSGGFGAVFEARDVHSGRSVALKELVSTGARSLERFKQEFRTLSDLHHPNLVRFDALFEHRGTWYIAMELVRGEDLISYVRPEGTLDPARLRRAFTGLLAGVNALHEAGLVHRDINPSNVCITQDGRAVLLDFGLLARVHDAREAAPLGSADYAPPEQLEGATPHASADIYALGGCLYEALSGRPPFASAPAGSLSAFKRAHKPRPLTAAKLRTYGASALHMLEPHPADRPHLSEVMTILSGETTLIPARATPLSLVPDGATAGSFEGRASELRELSRAFEKSRNGFTLVLVEGESGLGKSALCTEFARRLGGQRPDLMVLASRCYENELLALKAFDGVVDQLASQLRALSLGACEELLPRKASLLAQLFPVLGSVLAIAKAPRKGLPADPAARRRLGLACFIELLERLSQERPLLLLIDDLQWADAESLRFLASLSQRAASLPLLVICTLRARDALSPELLAELLPLSAFARTVSLPLAPLTSADAEALSATLLGGSADAALLQRLSEESKGNPLFLRELVEHARSGAANADASVISLDDAVRSRIERFAAEARRLIALLALAGRPCSTQVLARAMDLSELPGESLNDLLNQCLLRRRGEADLTYYHDRVRHIALTSLSESERRALAAKLAAALESCPGAEAAERARLWDDAGRQEEAIPALEAAGNAALEKLAFEAADQHFGRALTLAGELRDARFVRLATQRGHALVRMGKNAQAARLYAAAADHTEGEQRVHLRVWAAQNLIQGAKVEEGLAAAVELLRELGVPYASTPGRAAGRIAWENSRLALRGIGLAPRATALSSRERLALDALNELSQPVTSVMFLQGAALSVQHVRRALDAGEPAHAARALAYQGALRSAQKPRHDPSTLFARARELAEASGDASVLATVEVRHGVACLARDDHQGGRDALLRGHELVSLQCPGQPWLLTNARMQLGIAWFILGEHKTLAAHAEAWVDDAKQREDLYGYAALSGYGFGFLRHLMRDDPGAAQAELAEAMAPWPRAPFSTNHFGEMLANVLALSYAGGAQAFRWFEQNRARLDEAAILRNPIFKFTTSNLRANACLGALETADAAERRALLAEVRRQEAILRKMESPLSRAFATLCRSAVCAVLGDLERALGEAHVAEQALRTLHKTYWVHALYWQGFLQGGEQGRQKREQALGVMRERGWQQPERYMTMVFPVLRALAARG
jgi:serine/threonine protein kinase